jgi:hypothetical protein
MGDSIYGVEEWGLWWKPRMQLMWISMNGVAGGKSMNVVVGGIHEWD